MTDAAAHAAVIRAALNLPLGEGWPDRVLAYADAKFALDALVALAERAATLEAERDVNAIKGLRAEDAAKYFEQRNEMADRAAAAEERAAALEAELIFHKSEYFSQKERAAKLEAALAEATALLLHVVQADRDDARMGYPLPGDSCIAACIGLSVMPWLDAHAVLDRDAGGKDPEPERDSERGPADSSLLADAIAEARWRQGA